MHQIILILAFESLFTIQLENAYGSRINCKKSNDRRHSFDSRISCELAEYENARHEVIVDIAQYQKDFQAGLFKAFVIETDSRIVGTTIFYLTYSTWKGKMIYLEDFIIAQSERKKGYGKRLFEHFIQHCKETNAKIVRWHVLDWNQLAIHFYDKYPVTYSYEWVTVKLLL